MHGITGASSADRTTPDAMEKASHASEAGEANRFRSTAAGTDSEPEREEGWGERKLGFGFGSNGRGCLHESQTLKGGKAKFF